jgi:hypothetical protein
MSDLQPVIDDLHRQSASIRAAADAIDADADTLAGIDTGGGTPEPPNPNPGPITLGRHYGAFSMPLEQVQGVSVDFINKQADAMADLGVGWWRGDFPLYLWNPGKGQYNFGAADGWIKAGLARGIKPLPICYMLHDYLRANNSGDKSPPNNDNDFAIALTEAAKYFKSIGVTAMEVWNEQNLNGFWTGTPATDDAYRGKFARMMAAAYPMIKNAVPEMIVVSGGLSTADTVWESTHQPNPPGCGSLSTIQSYADKGLFHNCDAVGWHPYLDDDYACKDVGSWPSWSPKAVGAALSIIDAASPGGLSLWTTETGCPRSAVGGDQSMQAKRAEDAYKAFLPGGCLAQYAPRLGPFFWFCVADRKVGNGREDSFGFMNNNLTSKYPIYDRMKSLWGQQWAGTVASWANVDSGA